MGLLSPILRNGSDGRLTWWCPGCGHAHSIQTGAGAGPRWTWNGNAERPTFSPSVLVWWEEPANLGDIEALRRDIADAQLRGEGAKIPMAPKRCHSFVIDGQMQMLSDCTHALAGQTVPIPPWPQAEWRDG
jgi:hypothetical protein